MNNKIEDNEKVKHIIIKVRIDSDKDEFGNKISVYGYDDSNKILNHVELMGILNLINLQEGLNFFKELNVNN
jgi:hypothetical protein